jgi:hypothetical protein
VQASAGLVDVDDDRFGAIAGRYFFMYASHTLCATDADNYFEEDPSSTMLSSSSGHDSLLGVPPPILVPWEALKRAHPSPDEDGVL